VDAFYVEVPSDFHIEEYSVEERPFRAAFKNTVIAL
jgi:hypothetical protein